MTCNLDIEPILFISAKEYLMPYDAEINIVILNKVELITDLIKLAFSNLTYSTSLKDFKKKLLKYPYFTYEFIQYTKKDMLLLHASVYKDLKRKLEQLKDNRNDISGDELEEIYVKEYIMQITQNSPKIPIKYAFIGTENELKKAYQTYSFEIEHVSELLPTVDWNLVSMRVFRECKNYEWFLTKPQ